jgi:hypothetical protein
VGLLRLVLLSSSLMMSSESVSTLAKKVGLELFPMFRVA